MRLWTYFFFVPAILIIEYPAFAQISTSHWAIDLKVTQSYLYRTKTGLGGYASLTCLEPAIYYAINHRLQVGYAYSSSFSSYSAIDNFYYSGPQPEEEADVGNMTSHILVGSWILDRKERKLTHHLRLRFAHIDYVQNGALPMHLSGQLVMAGISFDKRLGSRWHWRIIEICPGLLIADNEDFAPFTITFGMGLSADLRFQRK